ncbi:MAG: bifunctional UDP-3-O-[3-hydroxymyristoyl] N-acetylglucosamine deacetylase/3-hydroxyacyl-ACP dehydratase [Saprospiraceae bacterium]|nr:bifunctional UDP-3-O-[3-hydroxymyristoyl] N-acetylglucosamine deacetylase/3-hydroxyacyl-ACP dehydratase [Saprospiraceae bacterium]
MEQVCKQSTIQKEVQIEGIGLHTGSFVRMTFQPAPENHGIRFQRTDLEGQPIILADVSKVASTNRGTTLQEGAAQVWTVEHVLSALVGLGIDNVLILINGPEIPIKDGSAIDFVDALESAGKVFQTANREFFKITEPISFEDPETGAEFLAMPSEKLEITTMIDFNSKIIAPQYATLGKIEDYKTEIAPCRTFVFLHELEKLIDQNLIKGGDLNNAIVIVDRMMNQEELDVLARKLNKPSVKVEKEGVLNTIKLYFDNEPARHKLLDVMGDLALVGRPIIGNILTKKPGHKLNIEFAKILKRKMIEQRRMSGMPIYDPDKPVIYDIEQIKNLLPHRYPFLLLDKVIELTDKMVVGVKNVTGNEAFFQGHFPGNNVFPGVLQIEALAQTGGILALSTVEDKGQWDTYFLKIDTARFKQKVVPGDTLILKMELAAPIRRGIVQMLGTAYVGTKVVCEADLTAQIVKRGS